MSVNPIREGFLKPIIGASCRISDELAAAASLITLCAQGMRTPEQIALLSTSSRVITFAGQPAQNVVQCGATERDAAFTQSVVHDPASMVPGCD
jgi:hypothetical protein